MSRIHEALKRAEQEKTANHNGGPSAASGSVSDVIDTPVPPLAVSTPLIVPQVEKNPSPADLHFDELWTTCSRPQWNPDPKALMFRSSDPFVQGAEQFRTLRSRLFMIREDQALKTVLVTSAIPAEGKTLVATNLVHAIVRLRGTRVLLIDGDLRSPRVHTLLGAPAAPGLADYLQGGASMTDVIQRGP